MENEEKILTEEEMKSILSEAELEETTGGHIVIRGDKWKAYKLFCPNCGSAHLRFKYKTRDVNGHPGEGNYDISQEDLLRMYFGRDARSIICLDCNAEFKTNHAVWRGSVPFDPNDYSD